MPTATMLEDLDRRGFALVEGLVDAGSCVALAALFDDDRLFRSTVDMARHRFGEGLYRYFANPLPSAVSELRERFYPPLAELANDWLVRLGLPGEPYPGSLAAYQDRCARVGQCKPTPLLLRYGPGGYNCLHQDLYGDEAFPFQLTVMLSAEEDYEGGEFLLMEQRPRSQSRGTALRLAQGVAVVFPTRWRPMAGARGWYRATIRHGVSTITAGCRTTLGVIFHDAS
jgi:hypothetical protein